VRHAIVNANRRCTSAEAAASRSGAFFLPFFSSDSLNDAWAMPVVASIEAAISRRSFDMCWRRSGRILSLMPRDFGAKERGTRMFCVIVTVWWK
jgi:hypothetical protein